MRPMIAIISALLLTLAFTACSSKKKSEDFRSGDGTEPGELDGEKAGQDDPEVTAQSSDLTGLPKYCKEIPGEDGKKCVECTPRVLPLNGCFTAVEAYNMNESCGHNFEKMELLCKLDAGKEFVLSLKQNKFEQLYEALPFILVGARAMIRDKLKDKPETAEIANKALEILAEHRKSFFTGENLEGPVDEIVAFIKVKKPDIKEVEIAATREGILKVMNEINTKRRSGELAEGDMITLTLGVLDNLPGGLNALLGDNFKPEDITGYLDIAKALGAVTDQQ